MVMIAVPVSTMAPFARFLQIVAAGLRLAAVFSMLALGIVQPALRITDSLLAFSVIVMIAVQRPRGHRTAQERENNQRRNKSSGLLQHASSSACLYILLFDAYAGTPSA
jgi:hypothetical protein